MLFRSTLLFAETLGNVAAHQFRKALVPLFSCVRREKRVVETTVSSSSSSSSLPSTTSFVTAPTEEGEDGRAARKALARRGHSVSEKRLKPPQNNAKSGALSMCSATDAPAVAARPQAKGPSKDCRSNPPSSQGKGARNEPRCIRRGAGGGRLAEPCARRTRRHPRCLKH